VLGGSIGDGPIAVGHDAILDDIIGRLTAIGRRIPGEADPIRAR